MGKSNIQDATAQLPLCVDLDGTLVRTDILFESIFALLKQNFIYILFLPLWFLKGKAYFKQQIADRVELDVTLLPYHDEFLNYLREQKAHGRSLVLATASNAKYAEQVALYLGIFEKILASDKQTNLSGSRKCQRLIDAFGERGFDYAGNAKVDLEIWRHAEGVILVAPEPGVLKQVERLGRIKKMFPNQRADLGTYIKALRLHQWVKNLLIFVPLALSHQINDLTLLAQGIQAFVAFGLCASSVYLLNDLMDLPADRRHPTKRDRPLAAGVLPIKHGTLLIPALLLISFTIALGLPVEFLAVLALYFLVTLGYSVSFKKAALVDVLVLAALYTLRLIAGTAAASVDYSFWLLAFAMFLFLSLALVKRYSELMAQPKDNSQFLHGRGYGVGDLEILSQFGTSSGYMAVLVLAFYINSSEIRILYSYPEAIWMLCPILLYWISRVWLLARRGEMDEDPVVFAIQDQRSRWLALITLAILWLGL